MSTTALTTDDLREAYLSDGKLEYHLMGVERGFKSLGVAPGWYPCRIAGFWSNGNVEIAYTCEELDGIYVTVLKRNIPIAFRKPAESESAK